MELLNDFQTSVRKAFDEIDSSWESYQGLVVCGTHSTEISIGHILYKIREARENRIPFLGICAGMQATAVEYVKNVLGIEDATSEEFGNGTLIVRKLPELRVGIFKVGDRMESHWHNYYIPVEVMEKMKLPYIASGNIVEEFRLMGHPFFRAVQYHPEYQNTKEKQHPILKDFIQACKYKNHVAV